MNVERFEKLLKFLCADTNMDFESAAFRDKVLLWHSSFKHLDPKVCAAAAKIYVHRGFYSQPRVSEFDAILQEMHSKAANIPDADEAFRLACEAIRKFGYQRGAEGIASLPDSVARAVRTLGWNEMCTSENQPALRAHFRQVYESVANRMTKNAAMSPQLQKLLGGDVVKLLEVA
jgi:hypothetical protein